MAVTIKDIARHLNLSKSTVSYALNGGPRVVSPEVRARVLAAADELGFRRNPVAQSLATRRTGTLGFVPPNLQSDWMYSQFVTLALQSVYAAAHARHLHVLLPSGYDPHNADATRQHLSSVPVDGFMMVLPPSLQSIRDISALGVPMVAVGGVPSGAVSSVTADNVGGARQALEHLLDLGHRHLGMLGSTEGHDTAVRFQLFRQYVQEGRIESRDAWIFDCGAIYEQGYAAAKALLSQPERPTAVFCVNDLVACGCVRAAIEAGLRVPEDLSIVGFDDDAIGQTCLYPITTVCQPVSQMARLGVELLLERIEGRAVDDIVLPTELIVRKTTTRP